MAHDRKQWLVFTMWPCDFFLYYHSVKYCSEYKQRDAVSWTNHFLNKGMSLLKNNYFYTISCHKYHRYPICGPSPLLFVFWFITFVGRLHYKQCWTTSKITKNSIRDQYKPISKNTKTLLYSILIDLKLSFW